MVNGAKSVLLVEAGTPGFRVTKDIPKLGYKGTESCEVVLEDVRVPAANLLGGTEGRGMQQVLSALEVGRLNIAGRSLGIAQRAYDEALAYSRERHAFGKPIADFQAIQIRLAETATQVQAARLMTYWAASQLDRGERSDLQTGMAKLFVSEVALQAAQESMRVHGGYGYSAEFEIERLYRDSILMTIGEDTGGSGWVPAAVNGIVGLRPTLGRVSNRGVLPGGASFDTVTPLATDVRTAAAMLAVLDHYDPGDPTSVDGPRAPVEAQLGQDLAGLRIGVATGFFRERVDPGVQRVIDAAVAAIRGTDATVLEVAVPGAAEAQDRMIEIMYPEAAAVHARRHLPGKHTGATDDEAAGALSSFRAPIILDIRCRCSGQVVQQSKKNRTRRQGVCPAGAERSCPAPDRGDSCDEG
ncbi:MAG TPA: acyl-CoA dehydrogenase family protein [Amycolatopsis sp.]|nr:acyl-CoA dehydrogenase family protein [Amycolatopsis sp.]